MNFKSILDKVFEKINKTSDKKEKYKAFKYLEENIIKNNIYRHQFELSSILESKKGKITNNEELEKFILKIKNKNYKFITENNITSLQVWQENRKLLEYYNINPSDIIPTILDKAIDINGEKKLNEAAIKSFIGKVKNDSKPRISLLKESFKSIIKNKSKKDLNINFKIVRFFAESLNLKDKQFIFESLSKLRSMQKDNFTEAVDKLYQLRLVTNKLIKEYQRNDDDSKVVKHSKGKLIKLEDLPFIKKIEIGTPFNYKDPEKIVSSFEIPFYPIGARPSELTMSALDTKNRLKKMEKTFLNLIRRTKLFDLSDAGIWHVIMRETGIKIGVPNVGKVTVYLNCKPGKGNSWEDYYSAFYKVLEDFQNIIKDEFKDEITSDLQKYAVANIDPNRKRADKKANVRSMLNKKPKTNVVNAGNDDDYGGYF